MSETHVYVLREPDTLEIRYVGKTCRGVALRLREHCTQSRRHGTHHDYWIQSLLKKSLRPIAETIEVVPAGGDWVEAEMRWIAHYRELGAKLVNSTDGGEGVTGRKWKPNIEQRQRMSASRTGLRASPEARKAISESLRRRYADPAEMEKRREWGRKAGLSEGSRQSASQRINAMWADPVRAASAARNMKGCRKKPCERTLSLLLPDPEQAQST